MKRRNFWLACPLLLAMILFGVYWRLDHNFPPTTNQDEKIRMLLRHARVVQVFSVVSNGNMTTITPLKSVSSPEEIIELIDHLWFRPSEEIGFKSLPVSETSLHFPIGKGQAEIFLDKSSASDSIMISHWAFKPGPGGSPPIPDSEEGYGLHPSSSRYIRRWLSHQNGK